MTCYLIHFSEPIGNLNNPRGQAQHYLGCTDLTAEQRFAHHLAGYGARITRSAVRKYRVNLSLVRVWEGDEWDWDMERWLKEGKNNRLLCPVCNPSIDIKVKRFVMAKTLQQIMSDCDSIGDFIELVAQTIEPFDTTTAETLYDIALYQKIPSPPPDFEEGETLPLSAFPSCFASR